MNCISSNINARDWIIERGGSSVCCSRIGRNVSRLIFNSSSLNADEKVSINPFNDVLLKEDCLK